MVGWRARAAMSFLVISLIPGWILGVSYAVGPAQEVPEEVLAYADLVLFNGQILTADDRFTIAEAIAIRDGRFIAVGKTERILRMAGPRTRKIDLQGKTVTPGFFDTHFHMHNYVLQGHKEELFPNLIYAKDVLPEGNKEALLRAIRKLAPKLMAETPADQWIVITDAEAHGIVEKLVDQKLTRQDLDAIFPERPVAVGPSHGNNNASYVVNSAGLNSFRTSVRPDIYGIVKDPGSGEPTGLFVSEAAATLGWEILPWPDLKKVIALHKAGQQRFHALGLTTVCTKLPGYHMTALRELWSRGELTMRWRANHMLLRGAPEGMMKRVGNLSGVGDDLLKISGAFVEATDGGGSGWTWEPRLRPDPRTDSLYGESFRSGQLTEREGLWANYYLTARYGWTILGTHSQGNRGNDAFLSAIEEAMKNPIVEAHKQRFGLDHQLGLSDKTPDGNQMERMKRLNVIPSMNATQLLGSRDGLGAGIPEAEGRTGIELIVYEFGADRVNQMLPVKTAIRAGLKPTSEADNARVGPLLSIEKLVTRKDSTLGRVWGADEKVSRQEALWMRTSWAARYTGDEERLGTIEHGKLADLVVIDGDYLKVPEEQISEMPVVMTIVGGKVVYQSESQGR